MERQNEEVTEAIKAAMSIESMPEEYGPAEYIGKAQAADRTFLLYRDRQGAYWYKTVFKTEDGYVSEYEHIFGQKRKTRRRI